MMLTGLADTLRSAGVDVEEEPGWRKRGHGGMTQVLGVTCHHTGGLKDKNVVRDGRPGLAGPLAQLFLARTGTVTVIAAGCCWHAGVSRKPTQTNHFRIGIEAEALGTGDKSDWPAVQMAAYVRTCKALVEHYGFSVSEVLGHKETCSPPGRKDDPSFDMHAFRDKVAALVLHPAPKPVPAPVPAPVLPLILEDLMFARSTSECVDAAGNRIGKGFVFQLHLNTRAHILGGSELPTGVPSAWQAIQDATSPKVMSLSAETIAAQWPVLV